MTNVAAFIACSFVLRSVAALVHVYIVPLPGGLADAVKFEQLAWEMSRDLWSAMTNFGYSASHIYSLIMAFPYAAFGRSPLMLQMFSVSVGTLNVYLVWRLSAEIWGERHARQSAWIAALLPIPIMYAALTLREAYFVLFLLLALLHLTCWMHNRRFRNLMIAMLSIAAGTAMHGGMVVALAVLFAILLVWSFYTLACGLLRGSVPIWPAVLAIGSIVTVAMIFLVDPSIPKLGRPSELLAPDRYLRIMQVKARGDASYPDWVMPEGGFDLVLLMPLRIAYFLFSPFIWDVQSPGHIIGALDAIIYFILVAAIAANFSLIMKNRAALLVFVVIAALIVAFAMGTSNFGAALRHRAKLVFVLVVLAAPAITAMLSAARPYTSGKAIDEVRLRHPNS